MIDGFFCLYASVKQRYFWSGIPSRNAQQEHCSYLLFMVDRY